MIEQDVDGFGFWHFAAADPAAVAVVDPELTTWTRLQLLEEGNRVANGLLALGLKPGDVVAVAMPNCFEWLAAWLACSQIGIYLLPVNWTLAKDELCHLLADSGASVLLTHHRLEGVVNVTHAGACVTHKFSVGHVAGCRSYQDYFDVHDIAPPPIQRAGELLNYTSGTTGRPKAVLRRLSRHSPVARYRDSLAWRRNVLGIPVGGDTSHLVCSPLYHLGSLFWAIHALHMGHRIVLTLAWHPRAALALIQRYRIGVTCMVPTHFVTLLKLPQEVRRRYDLSSLTHLVHGSAPCPVDIKRQMVEWVGPILLESYSSTEVVGTFVTTSEWLRFPGTVGKTGVPTEIRILDGNGNQLPPGNTGLVYLKLQGSLDFIYKGDVEKTRQQRKGEFVTVGDIGYMNDSGYLFLCDRASETIISRGSNIYPAELEGVLIGHPEVVDCVAFGIPHAEWGEEVKMFVQLRSGAHRGHDLSTDLLKYLADRVARNKCPSRIEFTDTIPRDQSGKLYRRRLRSEYWKDHGRNI
jgi:long-chain acyl-CoA synthetase